MAFLIMCVCIHIKIYLMQKKQNKLPFSAVSASIFVEAVFKVVTFESINESPALSPCPPTSSSPLSSSYKCYGEKTLKLRKSVASTFAKQLAFNANCPAPADPTGTQTISRKLEATSCIFKIMLRVCSGADV